MGMSNQTEEKELFHAVSLSGGKDIFPPPIKQLTIVEFFLP